MMAKFFSKHILASALILMSASVSMADNVKTAEGTWTIQATDDMSRNQCKALALESARNQALANAFGTKVYQVITTRDQVSNGLESSFADFVSATQMGGVWLGDLEEPKYEFSTDTQGNMLVTCTVKGRVRESSNAPADFNTMVLKNPKGYSDVTTFNSGDNLYVQVSAPSAGYTAIYLADNQGKVQTLAPYLDEDKPFLKLEKNKVYTFFDEGSLQPTSATVDPIKLVTDLSSEYCDLYVVFSPNSFNKAKDHNDGVNMPRSLSLKDFNRWLIDVQQHDSNLAVKRIPIEIKGESEY